MIFPDAITYVYNGRVEWPGWLSPSGEERELWDAVESNQDARRPVGLPGETGEGSRVQRPERSSLTARPGDGLGGGDQVAGVSLCGPVGQARRPRYPGWAPILQAGSDPEA